MSRTVSPSVKCAYGLSRVCRTWRLSRATIWSHGRAADLPAPPPPARPGPISDDALASEIRALWRRARSMARGIERSGPDCVSPALGPAGVASSG